MEILGYLLRPGEFVALITCTKLNREIRKQLKSDTISMRRCYEFLDLTSRSFAAVTLRLDPEIRNAICLFYLVLRALDTIEDDMSIDKSEKISMLERFSEYLEDPNWKYCESGDRYKIVLEEFPIISQEYRQLKDSYKKIIKATCRKMGLGMIKYLDFSPQDIPQWDEYCYYVAGMLGVELTEMFVASELEDSSLSENPTLATSMGLFLQKVNVIRDYLCDTKEGRQFWPSSVWKKYVENLDDFSNVKNSKIAVRCANELITNALQHVQDIIEYLSCLKNKSVFLFCAIPQVLAIATLERCYNNNSIFKRVVKIRKGEAAQLISQSDDLTGVKHIFYFYATKIKNKIPALDPSAIETMERVEKILDICHVGKNETTTGDKPPCYIVATLMAVLVYCLWGMFANFLCKINPD